MTMGKDNGEVDWEKSIVSMLEASDDVQSRNVKKLRKMVLLSLQMDESDKNAKKLFQNTVQTMEKNGNVKLDADGTLSLLKSMNKNKNKKRKGSTDESNIQKKEKKLQTNNEGDKNKNIPCKGNPQGVTRLFLGNLPFSVDESSLNAFLPGEVTHIKWITDKETGKFYGSAFIEMNNATSAADAVAMAGSKLIGRPIKINFAPAREGDTWPPVKKIMKGGRSGSSGQAGGTGVKAMSAKPDKCLKLFVGNLSYDIDDEGIIKFFANADAEVKAVRWLHHKDSGDFKGCGYVEFWKEEACEKGATLNGKNLLGRPIRIDWTE